MLLLEIYQGPTIFKAPVVPCQSGKSLLFWPIDFHKREDRKKIKNVINIK